MKLWILWISLWLGVGKKCEILHFFYPYLSSVHQFSSFYFSSSSIHIYNQHKLEKTVWEYNEMMRRCITRPKAWRTMHHLRFIPTCTWGLHLYIFLFKYHNFVDKCGANLKDICDKMADCQFLFTFVELYHSFVEMKFTKPWYKTNEKQSESHLHVIGQA